MFETCETIQELNMARVRECAQGTPIIDVNNAYNVRRKELLTSGVNFTRVNTTKLELTDKPLLTMMVYKGNTTKAGHIQLSKEEDDNGEVQLCFRLNF